jgi:hypothetical protein
MKALDRVFGCLLFLGGIGHGLGSYKAYGKDPMALLWALSGSFAVFLLASINVLRVGRKGDRALASICFVGCIVWIGFALRFGQLIGNMLDFRVLVNLLVTLALVIFNVRTVLLKPD